MSDGVLGVVGDGRVVGDVGAVRGGGEVLSQASGAVFPCTMAPGFVRISEGVSVQVRRLRASDQAKAMAHAGVRAEDLRDGGPAAALFAITLARMAVTSVIGLQRFKLGPFKLERDATLGNCCPLDVIDDLIELAPGDEQGNHSALGAIVSEANRAASVGEEAEKK